MKKRLATLICVMLFLCQNSLYVTAEAASVIQIDQVKMMRNRMYFGFRQFIKESILSLERIMHMKRI